MTAGIGASMLDLHCSGPLHERFSEKKSTDLRRFREYAEISAKCDRVSDYKPCAPYMLLNDIPHGQHLHSMPFYRFAGFC